MLKVGGSKGGCLAVVKYNSFSSSVPEANLGGYPPRKAFEALIAQGHSVIVIEHNLDVVKCADWVIDLGPGGGKNGGELVFKGTPEDLIKVKESFTGKYLAEKL